MTDSTTPHGDVSSSLRHDQPAGPPTKAGYAQLREPLVDLSVRTHARLEGADGVGITLLIADQLTHVGSNAFTDDVDDVQYEVMQGPCLSAHVAGHLVRSDSIGAGETRWPSFTSRAAGLDLRSVVSSPLVSAGSIIGSLNLYAKEPSGFDDLESLAATSLARTVEESLSRHLLLGLADILGQWFAGTVHDRHDIERASGALMDRYHLEPSQARMLLEQIAGEDQISEADAARNILQERP